jgi:hypothetical protein
MKLGLRALDAALCIVLLLTGSGLGSCSRLFGPPPDDQLCEVFVHHEEEFNKLVAMCEEDRRLIRIAPSFTWLKADASWPRSDVGLSSKRWSEYRSLFRQLGIRDGVTRNVDYPEAIFFLVYASGLVTDGSYKGFVYSTKVLSPEIASLDNGAWSRLDPKKGHVIQFRGIGANWYLFRERY